MSEKVWWYAARSSGFIAWALVVLAIVWGLSLSTRVTRGRPTSAWLLDLHRYLGALSLVFTAVHLFGLVMDEYVSFGWMDLFVPGASDWQPIPVAWGVVAMYLMVAIQLTSVFMRRLPRRLWRWVHMSSWAVYGLATVHALQAGTDVSNPAFRWAAVGSVQVIAYLSFVRVMAQRSMKRSKGGGRPNLVKQP